MDEALERAGREEQEKKQTPEPKKIGIKDINPKNISNFTQGMINFANRKNLPDYVFEQYIYRAFVCRPCTIKGKCYGCGCATPHVMFAPNKLDPYGNWPTKLSEEKWEDFKKSDNKWLSFLEWIYKLTAMGTITGIRDDELWSLLRTENLLEYERENWWDNFHPVTDDKEAESGDRQFDVQD